MKKLSIIILLVAAGCATKTGVITTGQDSFMILRQGDGFWVSPSTLTAAVTDEASHYCARMNKTLKINDLKEQKTGMRPGAFPEAEIHFSCLPATS